MLNTIKNKSTVRIFALIVAVLMVVGLLAACSASESASEYTSDGGTGYYDGAGNAAYAPEDGDSSSGSSTGSSKDNTDDVSDRKIIETISYSIQTKTFNEYIAQLEEKVKELGGYIENCNTYTSDYREYSSSTYTIKIPTKNKDAFDAFIKESGTVLSNSVDTEDVTSTYIDVESRLKSLRLEQAALEELLEKATSVEDILTIRGQLTQVIYEIESYESQLRALDSMVDYTTFNIDVEEVEHIAPVKEETVWDRIGTNLSNNFSDVGNGFTNIFVFLVSGLPYWLILGAIALIIVIIVRVNVKKARKKRARRLEEMKNRPQQPAPAVNRPAQPVNGRPVPPQNRPAPQRPIPPQAQRPAPQKPQTPPGQPKPAPAAEPKAPAEDEFKPADSEKE